MLALWREWDIDKYLMDAYNNGVIMCGVSAGAICWFQQGITDSWEDELRLLNGLNLIPNTACPHYDTETDRSPYVNQLLIKKKIDSCFAIEDGTAAHFVNEHLKQTVSFQNNKHVYYITTSSKEQLNTISLN